MARFTEAKKPIGRNENNKKISRAQLIRKWPYRGADGDACLREQKPALETKGITTETFFTEAKKPIGRNEN
jgi:hypothetical protein